MPSTHIPIAIALVATSLALTACSGDNTITYGGKTYKTVEIGEQTWMAENLNYEAEGSVCYDNKPDNCAKYGRLYNWETAMKVCPKGWHLPSNAEWDKLLRFVDGDTGTESHYNSPTAEKKLKTVSGWNEDGNGTDDYSFSALPGGYGNLDVGFFSVGDIGVWWSDSDSYDAYFRDMGYYNEYAYWSNYYMSNLFSIRCIKD